MKPNTEKRKKILLVDDAETVLLMEQIILQKEYDIIIAKDGAQAVASALAERPDLILLDIVMPNMDGLEACRKLREQQQTRDIPIIIVTTRGGAESIKDGFTFGCNDYVTKPINSQELLAKIKACLCEH